MKVPWRLRWAWKIMVAAYVGLGAASWGILSHGADLDTADGRHLLAGALANAGLVLMGIAVTANAYRRGERWAWIANWIPFLYGVPVMTIDSVYVGFWSTAVAPQLAGALVAATGLLLPADLFWRDTPSRGTVSNVVTR
jgi:hypothetical protein